MPLANRKVIFLSLDFLNLIDGDPNPVYADSDKNFLQQIKNDRKMAKNVKNGCCFSLGKIIKYDLVQKAFW